MLNFNNPKDLLEMQNYYRTSDMINLLRFFPEVSPVRDLIIILNEEDYFDNLDKIVHLNNIRVDSLKGHGLITDVECRGEKEEFLTTLRKVKEKDKLGVITLFNVYPPSTQRHERLAGIGVGIDIGECVYIDAVGKGFDGREISKSVSSHERYYIPWYELRKCCIENFHQYQTYLIDENKYQISREERIMFLESIGLKRSEILSYIPENYTNIPDFIWLNIIKQILKKLEKEQDFLINAGFEHFAIHGHTEGKEFCPWQMFDKNRYDLLRTRKK